VWNLGMEMEIQNYLVLRLCPSSDILETREHNVSESGSLRKKLSLALSKGPN
jgi:hypothetical protein